MLSCLLRNDKRLEVFFSALDMKKSYLLALSGGSDSLFLSYLLKSRRVSFIAVHVDYGWRESSYCEAEELKIRCEEAGIPIVVDHVPSECRTSKDPENAARRYRYALFHKICKEENLSGIFLAHHANDQAETVLKRLLEGASLSNLKGMIQETYYEDIPLFRPLLHIPKQVLVNALEEENISYIQDVTNTDERYLRARMRKKIFPWLEEIFGKNITQPLLTLAQDSEELSCYMKLQAEPFLENIQKENAIWSIEIPKALMEQVFLAKWVCKEFFLRAGVVVSRHFLQMIYDHLRRNLPAQMRLRDKRVIVKAGVVMIE
ncbi:tRNA(Ile)-lysidine synthase,tRNA(Ile)-lysidine synthetase,Predicted ATPase of the PP-loop superfamily implicated in cell cycle control,tRNA(Ile)-lysidine synthetase,PP-loop family [Chlamydia poikilotherma]|uniref:tRNA(Ile)-lysidine synthase n=1 Tax=Chlamydia poikilotherma TaxID=1967783 RepID=A0A3B0PN58_9CHLA|nr:tRNA lysidine(34) synthetase TilS [Chlamydia poikilotherma]SYX09229.1 tRNA(Ile)-lysidine synthase,tRNA(Ile)-lysidine synthetase,Predicted ATPase of the PP-loop superfamily implicated in cell cycle control,tRNA(Ile)-lysidine synthetase,PP-loop family [Chlamydia poikilotherma]